MGPLRVAVVIPRFEGGAGKVALDGALAIDRTHYEPTLLTSPQGRLIEQAEESGLDVVHVPELSPDAATGDLAAFRTLTRLLREGKYDVVHTHGTWDRRSVLIGRAAAARAGVARVVHTWHGPPLHGFQSVAGRRVRLSLERFAARHTDAYLAVGSDAVAQSVRLGLAAPDRIRACWPVVALAASDTGTSRWAQARRRLDLPLGVKVVGAVGRLITQKGPDVFLRALARLPDDVHGLWAGEGPLRDRLVRLTAELGMTGRVSWLGYRDDVADLVPAFDAMAVPSRWEGLPAVLVEAVVAGVPVVATAVASHHDLVLPRETGLLVPPDRPGELAAALSWILEHPDTAQEMARTARERIGFGDRHTLGHLGAVLSETYRPM